MAYKHIFSRVIQVSAVAAMLSGCATLDKKECLSGDWSSIGRVDGSGGKVSEARLAGHTKACGKHGVQVNTTQYMTGYGEGLKLYCTTEKGYSVGDKFGKGGSAYKGVCPAELEVTYLQGYINGLRLNLDILHGEIADEEAELESQRSSLIVLEILNSSKVDGVAENIEEIESSISDNKSKLSKTIKEVDKWLIVHPELKDIVN